MFSCYVLGHYCHPTPRGGYSKESQAFLSNPTIPPKLEKKVHDQPGSLICENSQLDTAWRRAGDRPASWSASPRRLAQQTIMSESPAPPAASASVTGGKASSPAPALPQKRYFRQRAHVNVLADHALDYPRTPRQGKWAELYPHFIKKDSKKRASPESDAGGAVKKVRLEDGEASASTPVEDDGAPEIVDELDLVAEEDVKKVEFADIGCGYGGLLSGSKHRRLFSNSTEHFACRKL